MTGQILSFVQALSRLAELGPYSPYRLVILTCNQPEPCARLVAAWQEQTPYSVSVIQYPLSSQEKIPVDPVVMQSQLIDRLNQLAESKDHRVLVLEEFDQYKDQVVQYIAGWLSNYLPPNLTVLITGSRPPDLPLNRLRVRRQLLEITLSE